MTSSTIVRVTAFSVPFGGESSTPLALAYCIVECTGPLEAHGMAIVAK
jgi:hypothetical protein